MSRWTATTRGTLRQRHRCQRIGESMWAWSQTWGLFTLCWGLYITGTCAIRIQCFGNTRTTWGNGNLLASFRTWIMTPVKLEYALQACYCTGVMLENVNAIQDKLRGIRWYIPLYRMYLYMKHIDIKIQPWGWCSSFFFFPQRKQLVILTSSQNKRENTSCHLLGTISKLPTEKWTCFFILWLWRQMYSEYVATCYLLGHLENERLAILGYEECVSMCRSI